MQGSIRFRGAGGPLTQRQHGNPTFTPHNCRSKSRNMSPWTVSLDSRHQTENEKSEKKCLQTLMETGLTAQIRKL